MSLCVLIGGKAAACLSGVLFSLSWTHSVEKTRWVEHWQIDRQQLVLVQSFVKGSGAGIDPAPHARLVDGWYQWAPAEPLSVPSITLANSQATPDNWQLCQLEPGSRKRGRCLDFSAFANHAAAGFTLSPGD